MRKALAFVVGLLLVGSTMGVSARQNIPAMPDYSNWRVAGSDAAPVVLNGKEMDLRVKVYDRYTDKNEKTVRHEVVTILYREDGTSEWLALYSYHLDMDQAGEAVKVPGTQKAYFYENSGTGTGTTWAPVADHSNSSNPNQDLAELLKARYKLVVK